MRTSRVPPWAVPEEPPPLRADAAAIRFGMRGALSIAAVTATAPLFFREVSLRPRSGSSRRGSWLLNGDTYVSFVFLSPTRSAVGLALKEPRYAALKAAIRPCG